MQLLQKRRNKSGIILIAVLWILVILSVLAMGLSRQTGVELQLTRYSLARARSRYAAISGINYVLARIAADSDEGGSAESDTRYQCGFNLKDGQTPEEIFKDVAVGECSFSVTFDEVGPDGTPVLKYGLTDEESRVNINALGPDNYKVVAYLLAGLGYDEVAAEQVASSVIDWRDEDSEAFNRSDGAEEDYYASLEVPYPCKNGAFESPEELLLVRGVTPEMFDRLKQYVTVFPRQSSLLVNFDTAPEEVLNALARLFAGASTNTETGDADSLVDKVVVYRRGVDGLEATQDDLKVDFQKMPLNAKERVIALAMQTNQTRLSNHLRARVKGSCGAQPGTETNIEAVIDRKQATIVLWRRR